MKRLPKYHTLLSSTAKSKLKAANFILIMMAAISHPTASFGQAISATRTTVSQSATSSNFGTPVTFTGRVSGLGKPAPTSTLAFQDNGAQIGTAALAAAGIGVATVSTGRSHTCALGNDGQVYCWGDGRFGQLGDGTTPQRSLPLLVTGITNAISVAVGGSHSCAVVASGSVYCWGRATLGGLGNGSTADQLTPVLVSGISNAIAVAAGTDHTCALLSTGAVNCWGRNDAGMLGNGATADSSVPVAVNGITNASAIAAGGAHTCAVLSTGALSCWGAGAFGALGNGATGNQSSPVAVSGITTATTVAAGIDKTCAVLANGQARCWGRGQYGALGNNAVLDSSTPVVVSGITTATDITVGYDHACAQLASGTAQCWGRGTHGRLGNGNDINQLTPVAVADLTDLHAIAAGNTHTCAVQTTGAVKCWGLGDDGQLGNGVINSSATPITIEGIDGAISVSIGQFHACAVLASGNIKCWGTNDDGQLGNGSYVDSAAPVSVVGISNAVSVAVVGYYSTCAVLNTGNVRCWGWDTFGWSSGGYLSRISVPETFPGISTATAITAGDSHVCVLLSTGSVQCWGNGGFGQLGNGSTDDENTAVTVSGITNATHISAGSSHTCARLANGAVQCWGSNDYGQIGNGTTDNSLVPANVSGLSGVSQISAGSWHTCALSTSGSIRCWGRGGAGQLGNGGSNDSASPEQVSNVTTATSLSLGSEHSCASLADDTLTCWGSNGWSQLGDHNDSNANIPIIVSNFQDVSKVLAGHDQSCALMANNEVRCVGSNGAGLINISEDGGGSFSEGTPSSVPHTLKYLTLNTLSQASFTTSSLTRGAHSITAVFPTTGSLAGSTSPAITHTVDGTNQTINFTAISDRPYAPGLTVQLQATATSNLTVAFATQTPAVCTVAGVTASVLAAGTCTITASQSGDSQFDPADPVVRSFTVTPGAQTITFAAITDQTMAPNKTVAMVASASSGLPVTFVSLTTANCTVSGTTLRLVAVGACTVEARQSGNINYAAAPTVQRAFQILEGRQTITFNPIGPQTFATGRTVPLVASASSGLPVTFVSRATSICTVTGTRATLLGPGECSIEARQAGNANYDAATPVTRMFAVSAALGAERTATTGLLHVQAQPSIAPHGSGAIMVYLSQAAAAGPYGVYVQRLTSAGVPTGAPIAVAPPATGIAAPHIAALSGGGFVVVWQAPDLSGSGIFAQRFSSTATKIGSILRVNALMTGNQSRPRVAALTSDGFAVVFETNSVASSDDVMVRRFNRLGVAPITETRVNTTTARRQGRPDIAALANGLHAVVWSSETAAGRYGVFARIYSGPGVAQTGQITLADLNQALVPTPVVAALTGTTSGANGFVTAYMASETASVAVPADVKVRTLSTNGIPGSTIRTVNTRTAGHQGYPAIAPLQRGAYVVAYETPDLGAGNSTGIAVRLFAGTGLPLGIEEMANTRVFGRQWAPSLAPIGAGLTRGTTFLTTWTTPGSTAANATDLAARPFQGP